MEEARISKASNDPLRIITANGELEASDKCEIYMPWIKKSIETTVLDTDTPSIISLGRRFMDEGYCFKWAPYERPTLITPDGRTLHLKVHHRLRKDMLFPYEKMCYFHINHVFLGSLMLHYKQRNVSS